MNILVTAPFQKRHMDQIRYAAGKDAVIKRFDEDLATVKGFQALREALTQCEVIIGEVPVRLLRGEGVSVKWLQSTWSGVDAYTSNNVHFPEGIMLTNAAGAYGHTISQFVVGQILALAQNTGMYAKYQSSMAWNDLGPVMSLEGAHVLVFGAGDLGQHVARRLAGFDVASITGVCRNTAEPHEGFDKLVSLSRAEQLLGQSDVIVGCLPSALGTVRWFGERRLQQIKQGAILVNVGRGDFIDCDALARILEEGHLRGAALDVTNPEPLPMKHPLWRCKNCLITPHSAGGAFGKSEKTEANITAIVCDNLHRYAEGRELVNRVL